MKALGKPSEILTKLNEMAGFSPNEEIELYEVLHNSVYISLECSKISRLQYACSIMRSYSSVQVLDSSSILFLIVNVS